MPAALRVRFLRKVRRQRGRLGVSRLIASRMVFRHRVGESPAPRSWQKRPVRQVCKITTRPFSKGDSPVEIATRTFRSANRTFPKVESRFPMDDSTRLHEGESTHTGRLSTRRGQLAPRWDDSLTPLGPSPSASCVLAGVDSPERLAPAGVESPLRHYRVPRHFLRGPFPYFMYLRKALFSASDM